MNNERPETRQEKREERLRKKKEKMPKHGKGLGRTYIDAIVKRLKRRER